MGRHSTGWRGSLVDHESWVLPVPRPAGPGVPAAQCCTRAWFSTGGLSALRPLLFLPAHPGLQGAAPRCFPGPLGPLRGNGRGSPQ